ncbi:MAG: 4Fe-4S dicluster domain-containing protein [Dehalococcoidia bacterium]
MPKAVGSVDIDIDTCKGCEICIKVCPVHVLEMSREFNALGYRYPILLDGCTGCEMCALICPDFSFTAVYRNIPDKRAAIPQ